MGRGNEGLEFVQGFGEVDFGGDDGVEPVFDDVPYALEDPGGFVDEDNAEGFGVVRFEAFDHEFDGAVVLDRVSGYGKGLDVKMDTPCLPWRSLSCRIRLPGTYVSTR